MNNAHLVATIDIGSKYLRMVIGEIFDDGTLNVIEDVRKKTLIGKDTFSGKRISIDTINNVCESLSGFTKLMKDYNVKSYKAVATSGIREAENKEYVLEQIWLKTGLNVEIINNAQERFYVLKGLLHNLDSKEDVFAKGVLVVNIGSGGVEVSVYQENKLVFTQYIKLGALRVREILSDVEKITLNFSSIVEEYVQSKIYTLKKIIESMEIDNFIGLGGELDTISSIVNVSRKEGMSYISNSNFDKMYNLIKEMNTEELIYKFKIDKNEAELLMPSMVIFRSFLTMTRSKGLFIPKASLRHGVLKNMKDTRMDKKRKQFFIDDIENLIWKIGKKYNIDETHTIQVKTIALSIFDSSKKVHKLGVDERILLQCAAVLHDAGKYINVSGDEYFGYNLVLAEDILGLSDRESEIIANIIRYHGENIPKKSHYNYKKLEHTDKIIVSKLSSILKLAESLDISHKNKISNIKIKNTGGELRIGYSSIQDTLLEEWSFKNNSKFFEEVMGVKPTLHKKLN